MDIVVNEKCLDLHCNYEAPNLEIFIVAVERGFSSSQSGSYIEDLEQEKW